MSSIVAVYLQFAIMLATSLLFYCFTYFLDDRLFLKVNRINNTSGYENFKEHQQYISYSCKDCTFLQISNKNVRLIEGIFSNMPYLETLKFTKVKIVDIQPGCLQNLPKLKELHVEYSNLDNIPREVFQEVPSLELISLTRSDIKVIASDAFDNMPNLKSINLGGNKLTSINPDWFQNCTLLKSVNLRDNDIVKIPNYAFEYISTTREKPVSLILSYNKINETSEFAFKNLEYLDLVMLDNNELKSLNSKTFSHIKYMRKLDLTNNPLKLDSFSFTKLKLLVVSVSGEQNCKNLRLSLRVNQSLECAQFY